MTPMAIGSSVGGSPSSERPASMSSPLPTEDEEGYSSDATLSPGSAGGGAAGPLVASPSFAAGDGALAPPFDLSFFGVPSSTAGLASRAVLAELTALALVVAGLGAAAALA